MRGREREEKMRSNVAPLGAWEKAVTRETKMFGPFQQLRGTERQSLGLFNKERGI